MGTGRSERGEAELSAYLRWRRGAQVVAIVSAVALGAAGVVLVDSGGLPAYLLCLAGIVGVVVAFTLSLAARYRRVQGLVSQECDVDAYRAVMEGLRSRDRRGSSASHLAIELAYCDYLDCDASSALERLSGVSFKKARNPLWFRAHQLQAMCWNDLGDAARRAEAVRLARADCEAMRKGSPARRAAEGALADLDVLFKDPASWDEADAARMRSRLGAAATRQETVSWSLYLAWYEALNGDPACARELLATVSAGPRTRRAAREQARVLALLDGGGR